MRTWRIGEVTVTQIVEWSSDTGLPGLIPDATPAAVLALDWLRPDFITDAGDLKLSVHALVIEASGRRIIVDTCIGDDKERPAVAFWHRLQTRFLADLEQAGFPPASIDTVLCTHLHLDHVGWNTMLRDGAWVPTFPNARYLFGRVEFEHLVAATAPDAPVGNQLMYDLQVATRADSVDPIFAAGLADLVETDARICDEVGLVPTLGHTPGHVSVAIASRGEAALITGDFVHHPCQLAHPDWSSVADHDAAQASRTRQEMFDQLAGSSTLVIGTHWAGKAAGRILRDEAVFRLTD